ncbi:hypothetical protein PYCCODRAFT_1399794 [Trametes coccinea BRFM310]|uniref:AB hydrolase-1 domain-containing protein n=1 Tax=Trametes coccinea (strain BRFM310) TaxID=1353009 RepID=A0A1Y2I6W0_TRAC3|nr:hypothetical protein PYCCODRAFT_1399794 [Trametes coccinea BRFM310]
MASTQTTPPTKSPLLGTYLDSGVPAGSHNYTTVVLIHGWGWHSAVFKRLIPFAEQYNTRLLLVNRRDYPGAEPYTPEEKANLARIASAPDSPETKEEAKAAMRDRGRELYDFLLDYVQREDIPRANGNEGGIIVLGWSMGSVWISALLAIVSQIPEGSVQLSKYVRRAILYDTSFICNGYPPPPDSYEPLYDETLTEPERLARFAVWVTGYYAHGDVWADGDKALEYRNALSDPAPTASRMTPEDLAETTSQEPQQPGGSEPLIAQVGVQKRGWLAMKDEGMYLQKPVEGASDWAHVEVVLLYCDMSIWETPWGTKVLLEELEEATKAGKSVRNVKAVRFRGANHFAHWDMPEKTLKAILTNESEIA